MTFCHYQTHVSPHVMPLFRRVAEKLGADEVRYIYTEPMGASRIAMGWPDEKGPSYLLDASQDPQEARRWLEECPCLLCGLRDVDLFELRSRKGLKTIYSSERWFRPFLICGERVALPGRLRMLPSGFRRRAMRIVRLLKDDPKFSYCGVGPYAVSDMVSLGVDPKRIAMGAYYVEPGSRHFHASHDGVIKLLWVGRMSPLKRVDTILSALALLPRNKFSLTLVGDGVSRPQLVKLARGLPVTFISPQPMEKIRDLMRQHDVFVFPSNAYEGWGAVVSEALEEGMRVIGSRESGSCAALLPASNLFECGDFRHLAGLLQGPIPQVGIGRWGVESGVEQVLSFIND